jgi:hypothetical protein
VSEKGAPQHKSGLFGYNYSPESRQCKYLGAVANDYTSPHKLKTADTYNQTPLLEVRTNAKRKYMKSAMQDGLLYIITPTIYLKHVFNPE